MLNSRLHDPVQMFEAGRTPTEFVEPIRDNEMDDFSSDSNPPGDELYSSVATNSFASKLLSLVMFVVLALKKKDPLLRQRKPTFCALYCFTTMNMAAVRAANALLGRLPRQRREDTVDADISRR